MNYITVLISGLYLMVTFLCIMLGVYFLYMNNNTILNRLAFLFCISLSCWCFGAALSLTASNAIDAVLWLKFSAIGAAGFWAFLLHYMIVLTDSERLLKKRWMKYVIYVPAIIMIYVRGVSKEIPEELYHFKKTSLGWVSNTGFSFWTLLFDLYMISFTLAGIFLIYRWKKKIKDDHQREQAGNIYNSYIISFLIAILGELLDHLQMGCYFHKLTPFILLVPILILCYSIRNSNLMKGDTQSDDIVFMEQFRTKIARHLSEAFCFGGILYLISQCYFIKSTDIKRVVGFSIVLCLFGLGVYLIYKLAIKKDAKVMLYSILLSIAIPIITLNFTDYAAITVWAFPFIIIIATLLFNNSTILTMVSTSIILTQLFMWIKVPNSLVNVDTSDYFTRIGLLGVGIGLIYYINKIYIFRLSQLSERIKTQDLLYLISSRVINVNCTNMKEKMDEVLSLVCEYVQADRAHIYFNIKNDMEHADYYCWCNEFSKLKDEILQDTRIAKYEWLKKQVKETGVVMIPDVAELTQEAEKEKDFLEKQNVKSMLSIPLISHEQKIGFLRLDYVLKYKTFDEAFIQILMTVGNILGEAYKKTYSEQKIEKMAYYDQLTNIPNRQLFGQRINQVIASADKSGDLFGIIFLDLDSFKIINDTLGHHYGDKILIMIADRLTKCIRKTDTVCRFGGDEFLIMLNNIMSEKDIETVATKIIKQLEEPLFIEGQEIYITASVGISVFPTDGMDNDTLIKNADIAMYKAKSSGKNQFVFCSQEMKEEIEQTMVITSNLYHALDRSELAIVYQPQVSIETGQIIAVEALARWYHPELGLISPAIFIPIAEHTSLINLIGEWILKESCQQIKKWHNKGLLPIRVAVNVSVNQLLNTNFVNKVMKILADTGLDSKYLELEITENIAIQESDYIFDVLSKLKALGISLAIDDFGTEYSSLNRIKLLPVDRLKIDMHFISGILNNEKDKVIVDVIIKLAKDLNLKVIAEGVETQEQLNYLLEKKCDEVQGYFFYKPLSTSDMEEVLTNLI
ncbi:EAL domain-containing protein [Lachnotalea glycerini]|uniref:EAL domain-containing protein n=1 Tax=Lachnotalea glycerini TaxID=1763509 RepID=A0A371JB57_9FIRM|nr:EAL domain-containing protein [Lachnotalea glycerini]RDY29897.1 EAL domain-containing protein [Lachnotalea glycerini]